MLHGVDQSYGSAIMLQAAACPIAMPVFGTLHPTMCCTVAGWGRAKLQNAHTVLKYAGLTASRRLPIIRMPFPCSTAPLQDRCTRTGARLLSGPESVLHEPHPAAVCWR